MAATKDDKKTSATRTARTRSKSRASPPKDSGPDQNQELLQQIDELQMQLASERLQRRMLIETNNLLARVLSKGAAMPRPAAEPSTGMEAQDSGPGMNFALAGARVSVPCGMSDLDAKTATFATIMAVDDKVNSLTLDTKFKDGLGWKIPTKRLCFIPLRNLVASPLGCQLLGQPADFESLDTVGDMVEYVKTRSVR